ncbi:hypothetical protein NOC27_930 [Nitrosococcus oceani AFC27]|nr:L-lactate permease [Nitrosococcus oceani]EDZ67603.1 hypothetical protein NOC27_930 [Nitrosococcus oceani AFC27]KFI19497.1 lactate permease [Nitrosococcus oceani C-27]GEM20972.1 L-lactate permease [Nitrosococcus oceani]
MMAVWAALPIGVALGMLVFRVGPIGTAATALACGVGVAMGVFAAEMGPILSAQAAMASLFVEVAAILFGGLWLSRILTATGAQQRLAGWLTGMCRDPARAVLLVVLGVVPFAESMTGFGIGVVVGIPLLIQFGFPRVHAAILGLLGLIIVPWGSLGPGTLVAARLTGIDFQALGIASALLSGPVFILMGAGALTLGVGGRRAAAAWPDLVLTAGVLWVAVWGVNVVLGTPLAGVLGSLASISALLIRVRLYERQSLVIPLLVRRDLAPYAMLIAGLLVTSAWMALWPGKAPAWLRVLHSPATWLLVTAALTPVLLGQSMQAQPRALRQTLSGWWPIALATVLFLALGTLLSSTGMSTVLAQAGAQLGPAYPALAPWIGALGGFLTGSNTGASAMFAASQAQAAQAIGYPVLTLVAFQNVAASLATMAAVPRVMMACRIAQDAPPPQQAIFATGVTADASVVSRSHVWPIVLVLNGLILVVLSALSMGLM